MPTAAPPKHRLTADQARRLEAAEVAFMEADAKAKEAREKRDEARARYRDRLPEGVEVRVAGLRIKVQRKLSGPSFRLAKYLERYGKVTKTMEPFVTEPSEYDHWQVKPAPPKPDTGLPVESGT